MIDNKGEKIYTFIKIGIFVALAFVFFFIRETFVEFLQYFIGGLMIFYGAEEILYEGLFHRYHFWHKSKNYLGLVEIILGVTTLLAPLEYSGVCIIWATWSIIRESYEIRELISEIDRVSLTIISGIESLVIIVFSVMLIFEPTEHHAMIHLYLLLIELILTPLIPLNDEIAKNKKEKENDCDD